MAAEVSMTSTFRELRARGFRKVHVAPKVRAYDGTLPCQAGAVPIRLEVRDWDFLTYPTIRLRERPAFLPTLLPHVTASGVLCYFAEGSVVLDRFLPHVAVAQCLEKARLLLDRMIAEPAFYEAEFRGEFLANWSLADGPAALCGLIGEHDYKSASLQWFFVGPADNPRIYVSADANEVARFCDAAGWPRPSKLATLGAQFQSDLHPAIAVDGLPQDLSQMFAWLKAWDRDVYDAVQEHLLDRKLINRQRREFLFGCPAGWFGFGFSLDYLVAQSFQRARNYRQYLHSHAKGIRIERRVFLEAGSTHIHQRNLMRLGSRSLSGKNVVLIGCGAIGGFVAAGLVRLGSGSGGGSLRCYDGGQLEPDNLGRHWLGYESLFQNKATAVAARAKTQFPFSLVEGVPDHVAPTMRHRADVIVNATGDAAFSEALNAYHVRDGRSPPVLHVWIVGNGEAAQGLWVDGTRGACYRCLRQVAGEAYGQPRFPLLKAPPIRAFVGCHAFTPYSTSMPTVAAALAGDFVMDWLNGDVSPRFRTRAQEQADVYKVKNQNVSRLAGCPACDH